MSSRNQKNIDSEREELIEEFFQASREQSTAVVLFHSAISEKLGLGVTDYKTLDLLVRLGPLTPKAIVEHTGLTSGSVTSLIDRLERKGFVTRVRDIKDRRSIIVEPQLERGMEALPYLESLGQAATDLLDNYTNEQIKVICNFLRRSVGLLDKEAAKLGKLPKDKAK